MTQPMDPNNLNNLDGTEYSWGMGMFPPGIANNEGQLRRQDDFGVNMKPPIDSKGDTLHDNYARAVADRRTDPTDSASGRDFTTLGNVDRYGANPPLVQADPRPNVSEYEDPPRTTTRRAW